MGDSAVAIVQEALLGQAAASAGAALLVSDDTLRYVAANDAACELLGYSRDELLSLRVRDVLQQPEASLRESARRVSDGQIAHGTLNARRKDGDSFPVQFVSTPAAVGGLPFVLTVLW
jgi:PAS domain S-box-containing protein